jgi:uncharacterized protein (DUF302 family)
MLYQKQTTGEVAAIVEALKHAAMQEQLVITGETHLKRQMIERGMGFDPECVTVDLLNLRRAKSLLAANPAASAVLPCRVSIYRRNGRVGLAMIPPTDLAKLFPKDLALIRLAKEVEAEVRGLIDRLCADAEDEDTAAA